jgi:hypothetical protein
MKFRWWTEHYVVRELQAEKGNIPLLAVETDHGDDRQDYGGEEAPEPCN